MVQVKRSIEYPYRKRVSKTVFIWRRHGYTYRKSAGIHKKTTVTYNITEYKGNIQKSQVFLFAVFPSVTEFLQNFESTWATAQTTSVYHAGCCSLHVTDMHACPPSLLQDLSPHLPNRWVSLALSQFFSLGVLLTEEICLVQGQAPFWRQRGSETGLMFKYDALVLSLVPSMRPLAWPSQLQSSPSYYQLADACIATHVNSSSPSVSFSSCFLLFYKSGILQGSL